MEEWVKRVNYRSVPNCEFCKYADDQSRRLPFNIYCTKHDDHVTTGRICDDYQELGD